MGFSKIRIRFLLGSALLSVFLILPASASNQVGVLGGFSVTGSSLDTGTSPNTLSSSSVASYKAGLEGDYDFKPSLLSLEIDLLYADYQWSAATVGVLGTTNYSTHWLELPLFVNYTGIQSFKFGLGPIFDFATGGNYSYGRTSVGVGFQSGYSYPLCRPWMLNADIRYLMGITNLSQLSPQTVKIHSFDFLVGVGYAF